MSKLLRLKQWITVPEAARHLSVILGEEVSEADMLRLALDGELTLSVNFVNHARGRRGKTVPLSEAKTVPSTPFPGIEQYDVVDGLELPDRARVLVLEEAVVSLPGIWDLPMIGSERLDVEHAYQQLTGGPEVTLAVIEGAFVQQGDVLCQLQDHFKDNEYFKRDLKKPRWHSDNYYPAAGLPSDSVFVIRTDELASFQAKLAAAQDNKQRPSDQLAPRAETTYLNIIGALLELVLGKTPAGKPQSVFESQAAIINALLAHNADKPKPGISKTSLETKFADARRRLNST